MVVDSPRGDVEMTEVHPEAQGEPMAVVSVRL